MRYADTRKQRKYRQADFKSCRQLVLSKYISETCVEKATDEQLQFVLDLLEEIKRREENKVKRAIKRANFPAYQTFNGYEYKTVKLPTILSKEELESLDFVVMKKNLVLYGLVGLGKTHMAIVTGIVACQKGYKAKFFTVTGLVLELIEAKNNNVLEKFMKSIRNLDLLILDEWGVCAN